MKWTAGLNSDKNQKHWLENERDYICKSKLIRLWGPYEVLENIIEPYRAL